MSPLLVGGYFVVFLVVGVLLDGGCLGRHHVDVGSLHPMHHHFRFADIQYTPHSFRPPSTEDLVVSRAFGLVDLLFSLDSLNHCIRSICCNLRLLTSARPDGGSAVMVGASEESVMGKAVGGMGIGEDREWSVQGPQGALSSA